MRADPSHVLADTRVCVQCVDGRITIEPDPLPFRIEERDGLLVMEALVPVEPLTDAMVEETRELRGRERVSST